MYRNSYLELYKTTANNNSNVTILLAHFTQVYNTLGCVLQDLEFQIGKMQAQQSQPSIDLRQQYQQFKKINKEKPRKQQHPNKEILVIDSSPSENQPKNKTPQNQQPKGNESKGHDTQPVKKEQNTSQFSDSSWMMDRIMNQQSKKPMEACKPQKGGTQVPKIAEKARSINRPHNNDSFDSLFEKRPDKPQMMEIQKPQFRSPLPSIPQHSQQNSDSRVENTYEDFLERIFKDGQSRKSR